MVVVNIHASCLPCAAYVRCQVTGFAVLLSLPEIAEFSQCAILAMSIVCERPSRGLHAQVHVLVASVSQHATCLSVGRYLSALPAPVRGG